MTRIEGGTGANNVQTLSDNIKNVTGDIMALVTQLQAETAALDGINEQIRQQNASKPTKGKDQSDKEFKAQLADWQKGLDALLGQQQAQIKQIENTVAQLTRAQGELEKLQNQMPTAQTKDQQILARAAEAAQKAADQARNASEQARAAAEQSRQRVRAGKDSVEERPPQPQAPRMPPNQLQSNALGVGEPEPRRPDTASKQATDTLTVTNE